MKGALNADYYYSDQKERGHIERDPAHKDEAFIPPKKQFVRGYCST